MSAWDAYVDNVRSGLEAVNSELKTSTSFSDLLKYTNLALEELRDVKENLKYLDSI